MSELLAGLSRRVESFVHQQSTAEELSYIVEEAAEVGGDASDAIIELALGEEHISVDMYDDSEEYDEDDEGLDAVVEDDEYDEDESDDTDDVDEDEIDAELSSLESDDDEEESLDENTTELEAFESLLL